MRALIGAGVLVAAVGAIAAKQLPEIRRYMKIDSM
jgi:hypothetical protein